MRERGDHRPGAVGVEVAGREVRQRLVFEIADAQLDDGVLAMLGLDDLKRVGAIGQERRVLLTRQQRALGVESAHAPNDQPLACERGLGDLSFAGGRVVGQCLPGVRGDLLDRRADVGL